MAEIVYRSSTQTRIT